MADVIYLPELAEKLGTTTDALRGHIKRQTGAIPPYFRMGRKYCWTRESVDKWIAKMDCKARKILGG